MTVKQWTTGKAKEWVNSQTGPNYWYQTIPVKDGIFTPGTVDPKKRLELLALPDDMTGKSILDIGCNSGLLCFECKKRNADRVVGIDLQRNRLEQARTLADIMGLDIEFIEVDLYRAGELGTFDIVFCIAVVTEVTDLIRALEVLKNVTTEILFLELATLETHMRLPRVWKIDIDGLLEINLKSILNRIGQRNTKTSEHGTAMLRRLKSRMMTGWSLVPDRKFINSIMGDEFAIEDLGMSSRYNLFKLTKKNRAS